MKIYPFGAKDAPVLLLLPGTCCHWKSNFGVVIPLLADSFRVLCVSYDGFDETEQSEFSTMLDLQAQMMLLLAIGVFLAKKKLITDQGRACLTDLLLFIILPANIIQSFRIEFNAEIFRSTRDILILSILLQVLYGVVMVLIHTVVMDKMLMMGASRTEVKIISSQSDAICAAILEQLDRGVTILHGEGGYTHESSAVLLSIVSNRELPRLEKLAHSIDPTCFLIVSHVTEVSGRGFSMEKEYQ